MTTWLKMAVFFCKRKNQSKQHLRLTVVILFAWLLLYAFDVMNPDSNSRRKYR